MKIAQWISFALVLSLTISCEDASKDQVIIATDLANFYEAYDKIQRTPDSIQKRKYLQELFLDKASAGQLRMIEARNYTAEEYLDVIHNYPEFWKSLRKNTADTELHNKQLRSGTALLKKIYPTLKPAAIYYTVGAFRSPGTGIDSLVLIGSEYALGDLNTETSEFKGRRARIANYYKINPLDRLEFLTVHEYVHTQQKPPVYNLLSHSLSEGIAEFVAIQATGQESPWKAFTYGPDNAIKVRDAFEFQMFNSDNFGNWLWNSDQNMFETADLGYYVGFSIAEGYFAQAENKVQAIRTLIELDYTNEDAVEAVVDASGYFSATLEDIYKRYEGNRPVVERIEPFENGSQTVSPQVSEVTVVFSEPMDTLHRGFDFGPLGADNAMRLSKYLGFSKDGSAIRFGVQLEPNKRYQLQLPRKFQNTSEFPMKPYLIDFKTDSQ